MFQHVMLKCHLRLSELYAQLNDEDSEEVAKRAASALTQVWIHPKMIILLEPWLTHW